MAEYHSITIKAGPGGWGGPITITPSEECHKVLSVTGGGIHPIAQLIADITGGVALDGFKTKTPDTEIMCAVVDCGGTARCGLYPKKGIYTVNLTPVGQSGPLGQFIFPEIYVSGVTPDCISESVKAEKTVSEWRGDIATRIGKAVGSVVNKILH